MAKKKPDAQQLICQNRRARHDYEIGTTFEAGIALLGSEVKSLREGKADLTQAYAKFAGNELFLVGFSIALYDKAARFNHDTRRERKLLLHRAEIDKIAIKLKERGYTLIPLDLHFKDGRVKVTLALARGRKLHDDRETILAQTEKREMRAERNNRRDR